MNDPCSKGDSRAPGVEHLCSGRCIEGVFSPEQSGRIKEAFGFPPRQVQSTKSSVPA